MPGLKRFLQYGRHLLRSRGRHGTHSPFVYAFVEQVMRARGNAPRAIPSGLGKREAGLLFRMLRYLKPQLVCLRGNDALSPGELVAAATGDAAVLSFSAQRQPLPDVTGHVLVIAPDDTPEAWTALLPNAARVSLLYLRPHAGEASTASWSLALKSDSIQMSLDLWFWGLIVKDSSFKARQHFRLR